MTLGQFIKQYRAEHGLSQRQLALKCGISNGFISMLERGVNPVTNKQIMPSMQFFQKLADVMNISLNHLFSCVDDLPVDLSDDIDAFPKTTPAEAFTAELLNEAEKLFLDLTTEQQQFVIRFLKTLVKMGE